MRAEASRSHWLEHCLARSSQSRCARRLTFGVAFTVLALVHIGPRRRVYLAALRRHGRSSAANTASGRRTLAAVPLTG